MSEERSNTEELDFVVTLEDEEGNPIPMHFLDLIEYQGENYALFLPCDEADNQFIILRTVESDDPEEEAYVSVADEDILNAVFKMFTDKFKDPADVAGQPGSPA